MYVNTKKNMKKKMKFTSNELSTYLNTKNEP